MKNCYVIQKAFFCVAPTYFPSTNLFIFVDIAQNIAEIDKVA